MLIGYARVSTNEQHLDLQRDALIKAGVAAKDIYTDKVTGVTSERPGLQAALSHLREGDTFIVWRLDRLGRSLKHLLETVTSLKEHSVAFKSLTENIDTSTATGNLVFQIFGALAEFERNLITERTIAGLALQRHLIHSLATPVLEVGVTDPSWLTSDALRASRALRPLPPRRMAAPFGASSEARVPDSCGGES